jgi:hypothetical protein
LIFRGFCALSPGDYKQIFDFIRELCIDEEVLSPYELHERQTINAIGVEQRGRNVRRRIEQTVSVSETDRAISDILGQSTVQLSKVSPLAEECAKYIAYITTAIKAAREKEKSDIIDPCNFWPEVGVDRFPILTRVAAQVLAAEATSGENERIATTAGIFYSPRRNRFKPETIEKMIFLQGIYASEIPPSTRIKSSRSRTKEFIKRQSISCQVNKYGCNDDFKLFLNGLCAWVTYEDDEEDQEDTESDSSEDSDVGEDV